jgi:hypothetical protein
LHKLLIKLQLLKVIRFLYIFCSAPSLAEFELLISSSTKTAPNIKLKPNGLSNQQLKHLHTTCQIHASCCAKEIRHHLRKCTRGLYTSVLSARCRAGPGRNNFWPLMKRCVRSGPGRSPVWQFPVPFDLDAPCVCLSNRRVGIAPVRRHVGPGDSVASNRDRSAASMIGLALSIQALYS